MSLDTNLDIVVVSYRCREMLRACLNSIDAFAGTNVRTFVVDNASHDGTVEMARDEFPDVELIASERNLGFSAANNLAIRRGRATFVLALNPDTALTPGALDQLVALMDSEPSIGICGCRLELADGTLDHASKRSFPTLLGALGHFTGVGRRAGARDALAQYRAPQVEAGPVDAVNGAFMLMRRRALDEVGLFDEGFWMYMEDLDLCYRFAERGWTTWYDPTVTVMHIKGGTSGKLRAPHLNFAFHYGMYRFYRKHYAAKRSFITNGAVYAAIAAKFVWSLLITTWRRRRSDAHAR